MTAFRGLGLSIFVAALLLSGCSKSTDQSKVQFYDIKGKVVRLDPEGKQVTLDHEDIPGFMKAMVMPFEVEDAKVLDGLKSGDRVHGRLHVEKGKYFLVELKKH